MKRYLMKIMMLLFLCSVFQQKIYAKTGVGVIIGDPTAFSIKVNNFPVIGVGYSLLGKGSVYASVDYWIINKPLSTPINWYLGVGGVGHIGSGGDKKSINNELLLGVRVPIGLQWWATEAIEIFGEIAPTVVIIPGSDFGINGGLGIRFYIF